MPHWETLEVMKVSKRKKAKQPERGPKKLQSASGKMASSEKVEGKEVEEKEEEKDKKKNVKYRRRSLWEKAKERIASLLAAKWKGEAEEKKSRNIFKTPQDKTSLGQVGKIAIYQHACGATLAVCRRRRRGIAAKDREDG